MRGWLFPGVLCVPVCLHHSCHESVRLPPTLHPPILLQINSQEVEEREQEETWRFDPASTPVSSPPLSTLCCVVYTSGSTQYVCIGTAVVFTDWIWKLIYSFLLICSSSPPCLYRPVRTETRSTWSTSCFTGQIPPPRMPLETLPCTSVLYITRYFSRVQLQLRRKQSDVMFLPQTCRWFTTSCVFCTLMNCFSRKIKDLIWNLCFLLQESCARILLYRGANKDMKNNSGQTPFQVKTFITLKQKNSLYTFTVLQNSQSNKKLI